MDEIAFPQIDPETYTGLSGIVWLEERLNDAIRDCRVVVEKCNEDTPTQLQSAVLEVVPIGISTAQAIFHLLKLGFLPAAHALCRPMFEYTGISNLLLDDDEWVSFWEQGWPKKGRPSLTKLISAISGERPNEIDAIHVLANEFHSAVHANPAASKANMAPAPSGELVNWFGPIPSAPERVNNIAYATALCAVILASNAKRAFFWDKR